MDDPTTIVERLMPKLLNYLISESPGKTVAHCLDLDLVAVAETKAKATEDLNELVRRQMRFITANLTLDDLNFRAPQEYWDSYFEGPEIAKAYLDLEVPPVGLAIVHRTTTKTLPVFQRSRA
jgi:hypothetical protein